MKFVALRALNLFESAGIGATSTFMPLFAVSLTNSYIMVGAIVAGYSLTQALSYAYFGKLSDRMPDRVFLIRLGFLLCSAAFFAHLLAFDGLSLFGIRLLAGVATGIYVGSLLVKSYEGDNKEKFVLAGIVSFGSLGWFVGTLGAGILEQLMNSDVRAVFALSGSMFLAGFIVSLRLKTSKTDVADLVKVRSNLSLPRLVEKTGSSSQSVASTIQLLRKNKIVYSSFFLRHLGASAVWSIFPIFLAHELGTSNLWIGTIYAINAVIQFIFMNRFGSLMQSNYYKSIQLGAILSALVFIAYFFSQSYLHILPVQIILGVSWSFLYVGSLFYLLDKNKEKATSSALLESTISVSAIAGPLIGGVIAEMMGIRNVLLFAFLVNLVAFALSKTLKQPTTLAKKQE